MENYSEKLKELLIATAKQNASDLQLAVGRRPTLRIDGALVPLQKENILTSEAAEGLISNLITAEQKEKLKVNKQIDFAYSFETKPAFGRMFTTNAATWAPLCA